MQVYVAGVMATWCLDKTEADNCCSSAILGSLYRSLTYSFGSICLGSLLQALVAVMRYLIDSARAQRQEEDPDNSGACGGVLFCVLDCIAELMEDLLRAFNQWAYIFVGLYGYSYVESGKRVMELFRARGFTAIITDNLVSYVLGFTTFMIALTTAATGWLVEHLISHAVSSDLLSADQPPIGDTVPPLPSVTKSTLDAQTYSYVHDSFLFGPLPSPGLFAASIGFVIGLWVASVMTNVLKGAVNTLIVCWADSPSAMESQHPDFTHELSSAWRKAFDFLDRQVLGSSG